MTRRRFLQIGLASSGVLLAACAAATPTPAPVKPAEAPKPTEAPKPVAAAATKPVEAAKPTEAAKPAEATKPAAAAETKPTAAPAAPAKPAGAIAPAAGSPTYLIGQGVKGPVRFWHVWGGREKLLEDQNAGFKKLFPDVNIDMTTLTPGGRMEKYLTAIAGGDPPEIMMIAGRDNASLADKNGMLPLEDRMAKDGVKVEEFDPTEFKSRVWKGKIWGLPLTLGSVQSLLYWNKDYFKEAGLDPEKPPKTWTELSDYATKLTKKTGDVIDRPGFAHFLHNVPGTGGRAWRAFALNNGAKLWSDDGKSVTLDTPESLYATEYAVGEMDRLYGGWDKVRGFIGASNLPGLASFSAGKLGMAASGVFAFFTIANDNPKLDFGCALFPVNDKNPNAKSVEMSDGGDGYSMPRGVRNPDAAWEYMKYSCVGEGNLTFMKAQLRPGAVLKNNANPEYREKNKYWDTVLQNVANSVLTPLSPVYSEITPLLDNMQEEMATKKKPFKESLASSQVAIQKIMDTYKG